MERATKNIQKHEKRFLDAAAQCEREASTARDVQHSQALGALSARMGLLPGDTTLRLGSWSTSQEATPRLSTVPGVRNPSFVGREQEVQEMHNYFTSPLPGVGPACLVIHGLGGQGKTQTALGYYWQHRDHYDATFWIRSETAEQLEASYLAIAKKLRAANVLGSSLPPSPDSEVAWEVDRALEWLEGTSPYDPSV